MAWPPTIYPPDRTNNTATVNNHPGDHNQLSAAITEIVTKVNAVDAAKMGVGGSSSPVTFSGLLTANGKLRLADTGDVAIGSTVHPFQIGPDAGANIAIDSNEIQTRNGNAASPLVLNQGGGPITVGSITTPVNLTVTGDLTVSNEMSANGGTFGGLVKLYEDGSASFGNGLAVTGDNLSFGSRLGQHIDLYSNVYGIGIQSSTQFYRSNGAHRFYAGGTYTASGPGPGGVEVFTLDSAGNAFLPKGLLRVGIKPTDGAGMDLRDDGRVLMSSNIDNLLHINTRGTLASVGATMVYFSNTDAFDKLGSITKGGGKVAYNTTSDYRIKDDHGEITDGLGRVTQLRPIRAVYHTDPEHAEVDAFIAHEVAAVVPEAVSGEKDAMTPEGQIDPQQIAAGGLIPVMVAAIKDLSKLVDQLMTRVQALESA